MEDALEGLSSIAYLVLDKPRVKKTQQISFKRHQAWIANINRKDWVPSLSSRVCSQRFFSGKFTVLLIYIRYVFDLVMHL